MQRNRWLWRIGIGLAIGFLLSIAGFFYHRHATRRDGEERLSAIVTHLDSTDPRWRIEEIETDRGTMKDEENSALLVIRFKSALVQKEFWPVRPGPTKEGVFNDIPPNHVLDDEGAAAIDAAMEGNGASLAIARSFKDYPRGQRRYLITPDFIGTLMPGLQETREVATMLDAESERLCRDGRPGAALELVRAMLNAGQSINGEPFLVSCLVRMACDATAARRVERILGLANPKGGLAEVQAMLLAEAEADHVWVAVRGERAGMNMLFINLQNGSLPPGIASAIAGAPGSATQSPAGVIADWVYEPYLPGDQATYLEAVTKSLEVRNLPEHQQRAAMKAIPAPEKSAGSRLTNLLLPALHKVHDANIRTKANLRCAAVGVALERFRLRNGRWPETLAEIPRDLLEAVPLDPFDGKPLKYVRRPDGVTVYSIGLDEQDNAGNVTNSKPTEPGIDIGFRLFDPAHRCLPPIPRPTVTETPNPRKLDIDDGPPVAITPEGLPFPRAIDGR